NQDYVIKWKNSGEEVIGYAASLYGSPTRTIKSMTEYFKPSVSWSKISSGDISFRYFSNGFIFDVAGCCIFFENNEALYTCLGFVNSPICKNVIEAISPTVNYEAGHIASLPFSHALLDSKDEISQQVKSLIAQAKIDWDSYEISWDFTENPIIRTQQPNLEQAFHTWQQQNADAAAEMKRLEEENNKLFIDAYGLQDELTPDVPDAQITLTRADREKDSQRLVSYALGCMMGRYSLDEPGLIYAHAGNQDFDASRYQTFPADADGIIPLTEMHWFEDDATHRIREFLTAVWGKDTLDANMLWLAESLDKKASETAEDTIRRYLASKFY